MGKSIIDQINSPEFEKEVKRKMKCYDKYAEIIEQLIKYKNGNIKDFIKTELVKFLIEYNQSYESQK